MDLLNKLRALSSLLRSLGIVSRTMFHSEWNIVLSFEKIVAIPASCVGRSYFFGHGSNLCSSRYGSTQELYLLCGHNCTNYKTPYPVKKACAPRGLK